MKQDLDRLMRERGLDALWIAGPANHNPALVYFTGVANITRADLIKKQGEPPVIFHYPMEREEAARTGLACRNYNEFRLDEIMREAQGNSARAGAIRMSRVFRDLGIRGRVAVGGTLELSAAYGQLTELSELEPDLQFLGEGSDPILLRARATKDAEEIRRVRRIGTIAASVLGETAGFLTDHSAAGGVLAGRDGTPLTIGAVKAFIRRALAEHGAEEPEGTIFAQGRDGAIPHSTGTDDQPVRTGVPIVFDLFPCEAGGGYFYDVTRTWCIGNAGREAEGLYRQVRAAYELAESRARGGLPARELQPAVCDYFEAAGHPTVRTDPQTERGYVHNVGHGVGLDVHESPSLHPSESNRDVLEPGSVFTIEPGLYYPERGMGVRLENTVWIRPDGAAEVVAPYPLDFVLPLRKGRPRRTAAKRSPAEKGRKPARAPRPRRRAR